LPHCNSRCMWRKVIDLPFSRRLVLWLRSCSILLLKTCKN
jgi:hypothetical protein